MAWQLAIAIFVILIDPNPRPEHFVLSCTLIGCEDGANLRLSTPTGTWVAGDYELTVRASGITHTCRLEVPDDLDVEGMHRPIPCDPPLGGFGPGFEEEVTRERSHDSTGWHWVTRLEPNRHHLQATVRGTPQSVVVTLARDGVVLLQQRRWLSYRAYRPNGPNCDPECHGAFTELVVPADQRPVPGPS